MLTFGAINHIFNNQIIPLNVQIETSQKLMYLQEEELVLNQCQIYDGELKQIILIKSQYTFYLNQQLPTIRIVIYRRQNGTVVIDQYQTLPVDKLIPFNINQYLEMDQVILYDPKDIQPFSFTPDQRITIMGQLTERFITQVAEKGSGNLYKIAEIQDCLSDKRFKIISFQNDWGGNIKDRLDQIEQNQDYIYRNILVSPYQDKQYNHQKMKYKIDMQTTFYRINTSWTNYDEIKIGNLGQTFNFFGYILKIRNIQEKGYQIVTISNFRMQKVKVIIKLPFAQEFQLQENTIVGFKNLKVIKKSNYYLGLSFNDESKLCKNTQNDPFLNNQPDFKNPQYPISIKLKEWRKNTL